MLTTLTTFTPASTQFNLTHHVRKLSFGEEYPGQVNPLDGHDEAAMKSAFSSRNVPSTMMSRPPCASHLSPAFPSDGLIMYQYFVKVVPTRYQRVGQPEVGEGSLLPGSVSFPQYHHHSLSCVFPS